MSYSIYPIISPTYNFIRNRLRG